MVRLLLKSQKVTPWTERNGLHIRGWYEYHGTLYDSGSPEDGWTDCAAPEDFSSRLREMIGNYSVILETDARVFVAVDRIISYPLYYTRDAQNNLCISDSLLSIKEIRDCVIDEQAREELLASGFILGRKTIYKDVFQLQGGEMLVYDKETDTDTRRDYFLHTHSHVSSASPEELCKRLDAVVLRTFQRMIDSIHGKTIVLFLSGGYDSRLVATTLKRLRYPNVVCVVLGGRGTRDAVVGQRIAEQLGFPLIKLKYDKAYWKKFRASGELASYFSERAAHCALPYLQGIVLKDLIQSGAIPKDCVALTGNSGDAIEGRDVTHRFFPGESYSVDEVVDVIRSRHFALNGERESKKLAARFDPAPYLSVCGKDGNFSDEEAEEIVEFFNWRERQCKYVVNDIRNYDDVLGIEWRLPLWDSEFVDFWLSVPYDLRYDRKLYYQYVSHEDLPTANNPSLARRLIDAVKKVAGSGLHPLYYPKAFWDYFVTTDALFSLYGCLTFSDLLAVLRVTKGYGTPYFGGVIRLFLNHF